jgi:hypothetical protein
MHRLLLISAALALAACADPPEGTPDFDFLHAAIIEPSCATIGCHSAATAQGDKDFSTRDVACEEMLESGALLIPLLRGEEEFADYPQMPPDVPLPETDIELLARWLNAAEAGDVTCP